MGLFGGGPSYEVTDLEKMTGDSGLRGLEEILGMERDGRKITDMGDLGRRYDLGDIKEQYGDTLGRLDEASESLRGGPSFERYQAQRHGPAQFDFQNLPEQYGSQLFDRGSRDLTRGSQDSLTRMRETIGTRRPDLLFKASQENQRNLGEQLGGLREGIGLDVIRQNVDLGRQEQLAQAAENMGAAQFDAGERGREYQSGLDLENAAMKRAAGLGDLAGRQTQLESGLLDQERSNSKEMLQMFLDTYYKQQSSRRQINAQNSGGGMFGDILGAAGSAVGGAFGGPAGAGMGGSIGGGIGGGMGGF